MSATSRAGHAVLAISSPLGFKRRKLGADVLSFVSEVDANPIYQILFGTSGVLLVACAAWPLIRRRRSRAAGEEGRGSRIEAHGGRDVRIQGNTLPAGSQIIVRRGKRIEIRDNGRGQDGE